VFVDKPVRDLRITLSCRKESSKDHRSLGGKQLNYNDSSRDKGRRPDKHRDYHSVSRSHHRSGDIRSSKYPSGREQKQKGSPERHPLLRGIDIDLL